jgi:hypothetical protein
MPVERVWNYLQRLTPLTRSYLLAELERLELCGAEMPGSAEIVAKLRAEFHVDGPAQSRTPTPQRYFFAPLEPLLVDGAPEYANSGRIPRGSLTPIWEWITRDLLPTMARDFNAQMQELIAADKQRDAAMAASTFQTKVVKSLQNTLGSGNAAEQIRARLAAYTASRSAFDDVVKTMHVLWARDVLAEFANALPRKISNFDDAQVRKVIKLLDEVAKKDPEAIPFAIALVGGRLKPPWQLMRLATKSAVTKSAFDIAAAPYAIAVPMVLDQLEDKRTALRIALKSNHAVRSRELLVEIYDMEYALRVRIDQLEKSEWGTRLRAIMDAIAALVEEEINRFPDEVGHILGSRRLRSHDSIAGKLTYYAWKGRDVVTGGVAQIKRLMA